ncbi:MAG: D-arabinono-1,4-lactone oxidase [Nakamurella sp.]
MLRRSTSWQNWGRSAAADFAEVAMPQDTDAVVALVRRAAAAGLKIRPLGAGHSFTPLGVTAGISVRLDRLSGVLAADPTTGLVTLGAGTRLHDLPRLLQPHGLALQNLGDIDTQTIAGAIGTGTHGTGAGFTGIADQVRGLTIVLADGSVLECSADTEPDLFQAARIGLGAFGVVTAVTLQCVPTFVLAADEHPEPLESVLQNWSAVATSADHVEFYWFPHTEVALVKRNTRLPASAPREPLPHWRFLLDDELVSNGLFELTNRMLTVVPAATAPVNRLAAKLISDRRYSADSQRVFNSPRRVRFREMEYAVPRELLPDTLRQVRKLIDSTGWRIPFPLEIRVAAADDVWLSTAYRRDSAYLAVHQYHRRPFAEYFLGVEQILAAAGGRPHWGKLHTMDAAELAARYPRFADVQQVRDRVDPDRLFGNDHLRRVLG